MKVRTFVISVSSEKNGRRQFVSKNLERAGMCFEFFKATDGSLIDDAWINNNVSPERQEMYYSGEYHWLTKGQLGCADSHRRLAQQLLDDDADAYLVFEDDVHVEQDFFVEGVFDKILEFHDLVLLSHSHQIKRLPSELRGLPNGYSLREFPPSGVSTASAYLVNKTGARMIVEYQYPKIRAGADNWNWFVDGQLDRCAITWPRPVTTGYFESSIRKSRFRHRVKMAVMGSNIVQFIYRVRQRRNL